MLAQLKEQTKEYHQSVEKVLITKLKNLSNIDEYRDLLLKLHNFYAPLEKQVHNMVDETVLPDIGQRMHSHKLESDLEALGSHSVLSANPFLETIDSISYALGILYVIEGSTLGGQIISGMLKKQLPNIDDQTLNYFNSYGRNTPVMWSAFKMHIENPALVINKNEMLAGAKATFENLRMWLLSN